MSDSTILSPEAEIYKKAYFELFAELPEPDQKKVLAAVGQDNVTDKDVIRFIKRVIAKAEASNMDVVTPKAPESSGTEDKGELVPA